MELNDIGAAIGEMAGSLSYVILYLNDMCWTGASRDLGGEAFVTAHRKADILRGRELSKLFIRQVREVSTRVASHFSDLKLTVCARR